jgi:hypothetical protein
VRAASAIVPVTQVPTGNVKLHQVGPNGIPPLTARAVSAAAMATIPAPMTAANQFGATPRTTSPSRCFSSLIPNGRG